MRDTLTILHAPCHGPSLRRRHLRRALRLRPDSAGFTEAYLRTAWLRARPLYRCMVGKSFTDTRRGAKDTPVLVRRCWPRAGGWAFKAAPASSPRKIAPERWITAAIYRHPFGTIEHINSHPHASVQGRPVTVDRVEKYAQQAYELEGRIKEAKARGHLPVVTGDLQWPLWGAQADYAPAEVFGRCGLLYWAHGIDWIAYDPALQLRSQDRRVIDPKVNGQDHPWLLATFRLRRTTTKG